MKDLNKLFQICSLPAVSSHFKTLAATSIKIKHPVAGLLFRSILTRVPQPPQSFVNQEAITTSKFILRQGLPKPQDRPK